MTFPTDPPPRRRILYIRHRRTLDISDAFRMNQDEWFETLSLHADVALQDTDFDMGEACDRIRPDFILYESPFFFPAPLRIKNATAHPGIPRIGFQMQDPYCSTRVNFLRRMEALNIRWIFTHMTETALNQSPELKACTFSTSLLFDERIFRDYGLKKDTPVSVFGGFLLPEIYDWRAATARALPEHFSTFIYAHPGYRSPVPRHKFPVMGEDYARAISRSHFSIADTTVFDCLVRKHLEIPACGTVLVAPDTHVLKPYGFRDMENCILGKGSALFDKMAAVADDPVLYEKIRANGHDLVHARYSRKHWRGILDFYECLRNLKPGETVQQQGILGPFKAVPATGTASPAIAAPIADNAISALLKTWERCILDKDGLNESNNELLKIPPWLGHMVEPLIQMGIIALLKGNLAHAHRLFQAPQILYLEQSGAADYDPQEIAWLSLTAALLGDAEKLNVTRQVSATMRHLSLRRMQWLGKILASGGDISNPPPDILRAAPDDQISIHWLGNLPFETWLDLIGRILDANGQGGLLHATAPSLDSRRA